VAKDFSYSGIDFLTNMESSMQNYNKFIIKQFGNLIVGNNNLSVLDFGSGIGTLPDLFFDNYNVKTDCFEVDKSLIHKLQKRGYQVYSDMSQINKLYDLIYTSNVLEHIENSKTVLLELVTKLSKGGYLAIFVPANKNIYTSLDKKLGHFRRYSINELRHKLDIPDIKIIECRYVDFLGTFAWLFTHLKRFHSTNKLSSNLFIIYDNFIWPITRFFDTKLGLQKFLGKNIYCVVQKID